MLARTERVRNAFPIAVGWNIPRAGSSAARGCKHHKLEPTAGEVGSAHDMYKLNIGKLR